MPAVVAPPPTQPRPRAATESRFRVVSLASGSSGNAYLVQTDDGAFLVDAGISAAKVERSLAELNLAIGDLAGILLTHEHRDHIAGLRQIIKRHKLPIYGNTATLAEAGVAFAYWVPVEADQPFRLAGADITPFPLPHDATAMMSYRIGWQDRHICFLTDLGHCPAAALDYARAVDLLVLEANHDVGRLTSGPYPYYLQKRILGPLGHLSNQQAADCALACVSGAPQTIWLAHLSQTNNDPLIARETVDRALARDGVTTCVVKVAARDRRSLSWNGQAELVQLRLF